MRNLKMMKLTNDQFDALAYIFEKENGNKKSDYEKKIISESGLADFEPELLERNVVDGLENGIYDGSTDRISAYWALGKRFNRNLIPSFQKWLQKEFDLNDSQAVYQLLISLGNMEEPVFNPDRKGGSASYETELNMRDAGDYLNKKSE
jgi:hypothetical protein